MFKTPQNKQGRRKRMLYHGVFLLILVIFNALTKFILNQGTFTEWIITSAVGILGLAIVLISIYGNDNLVLLYFWKWRK